jgi:hypothetical protein
MHRLRDFLHVCVVDCTPKVGLMAGIVWRPNDTSVHVCEVREIHEFDLVVTLRQSGYCMMKPSGVLHNSIQKGINTKRSH